MERPAHRRVYNNTTDERRLPYKAYEVILLHLFASIVSILAHLPAPCRYIPRSPSLSLNGQTRPRSVTRVPCSYQNPIAGSRFRRARRG